MANYGSFIEIKYEATDARCIIHTVLLCILIYYNPAAPTQPGLLGSQFAKLNIIYRIYRTILILTGS
jgi:hypothetical protein